METSIFPFDLPLFIDWIGIAVGIGAIVHVRRLRAAGKTLDRAVTYFVAGIAVFVASLAWERFAEGIPALGLPHEEPHHILMMTSMFVFAYASSKFVPSKDELVKEIAVRKNAEKLLGESELMFRTLTENAPVGVSLLDDGVNLVYVNKAGQEILGATEAEMKGHGWKRFVHPDEMSAWLPKISENFRSRRGFNIEWRMIRKDGSVRWVNSQVAPAVTREGRAIFINISIDVTAAKEASQTLQQKTEQLEKAMNLMVGREKQMIELKRQIRKGADSRGERP